MSAVLLALFDDCDTAERVWVEIVRDGFPTDRVELTTARNPGRAALVPGSTPHQKLAQYFTILFPLAGERQHAEAFATHVENGAAAVTVHPRGGVETARAQHIFRTAGAREIAEHDIAHQPFEYAASRDERPWISNFWVETHDEADCLYCRLFESAPVRQTAQRTATVTS